MGEHAAVYGRPALVAAIDRRLTVDAGVDPAVRSGVRLVLPQVDVDETVSWDAIRAYTERCRERWARYRDDPSPEAFAEVRGEDPAHVVKIALGEAAARAGQQPEIAGWRLSLRSDLPVGSGFGSSAAVAVGVTRAYLTARQVSLGASAFDRLTRDVERRQHGLPSGVDTAAVVRGGVIRALAERDGIRVRSFPSPPSWLDRFAIFDTGRPTVATGAVVARVRERFRNDSTGFESILDRMSRSTDALCDLLTAAEVAPAAIIAQVRAYQRCLEAIGVVPDWVCERVRRIEAAGGAAKISGAGAHEGRGAGSLLVYHPKGTDGGTRALLAGAEATDVRIGGSGARVEST